MRKGLLSVILICISSLLCAASVRGVNIEDTFESTDNLSLFSFTGKADDASYYDDVHFYLVTQAPGDEVYTWFGHTGLMMESPQGSIMFDWGTFSFSPSFYLDFCFGRLYYTVSTNRADAVINRAISENRRVEITELPIGAAAKKGLMEFLAYNTQWENRNYLYHYYLDNCATRVRDIIDFTSGGAFRTWAESIMTGMTFRDLSSRYMNKNWLVSFTLNFLEGPSIDRQLNLYEACFLPDVLNSAVKTFYALDDNVIFQGEEEDLESLPLVFTSLLVSLSLTLLLFILGHFGHERLYGLVSAIIWLYAGIASSVLFFMMLPPVGISILHESRDKVLRPEASRFGHQSHRPAPFHVDQRQNHPLTYLHTWLDFHTPQFLKKGKERVSPYHKQGEIGMGQASGGKGAQAVCNHGCSGIVLSPHACSISQSVNKNAVAAVIEIALYLRYGRCPLILYPGGICQCGFCKSQARTSKSLHILHLVLGNLIDTSAQHKHRRCVIFHFLAFSTKEQTGKRLSKTSTTGKDLLAMIEKGACSQNKVLLASAVIDCKINPI